MTVGTGMGLNVNVLPSAGGNLPCDATQGCTESSYGAVLFLDGATVLGTAAVTANFNTAPAQFRASLSWIPTTTGARTITAQYLGTTPNAPSSVSASVTVNPAAATTTTWVVTPPATMTVGTGMGLNVNVLPSAGGNLPCDATLNCSATSYGSVRFLDGATVLGTAAVTANFNTAPAQFRASLSWVPTTTGSRTVTAQYLGTTPNAPSSVSASVTVNPAAATTTTWVVTPPATMTVGTGMGLNVNVLPSAGGNLPCDATLGCTAANTYGSVRFLDGATVLGTASVTANFNTARSEERRVGKECRSRWSPYH